ncbi:MAG: hypothetical protein ACOCWQ_06245 [Nanoarchaeota archaeon]
MLQKRGLIWVVYTAICLILLMPVVQADALDQAILDATAEAVNGRTYEQMYGDLTEAFFAEAAVVTAIGDKLWVPWFSSSSSCGVQDLQQGHSCDSGETIDFEHNCMVTDEFSQVAILAAMNDDPERMRQAYNTLKAIPSAFGRIPAWRVYRDGDRIEPCRDGINGNCDSASDATARFIIALLSAAQNPAFSVEDRQEYQDFGLALTQDMIAHEIRQECHASSVGDGEICYWLAAGSRAQQGGLGSWDFGYTGYYADAIMALLSAYEYDPEPKYIEIAHDLSLNYLQAAQFDGVRFSTPPGRSFRWDTSSAVPEAECTNGCWPQVAWDDADAPRALGMCQTLYYADEMDVHLPELAEYCDIWGEQYMQDVSAAPIMYTRDGQVHGGYQSGYFAQGLQSLFLMGYDHSLFAGSLDAALEHYSYVTRTWDWTSCFGIYHQAFPMRALGSGLGYDRQGAFASMIDDPVQDPIEDPVDDTIEDPVEQDPVENPVDEPTDPEQIEDSDATGASGIGSQDVFGWIENDTCTIEQDDVSGDCRTVRMSADAKTMQIMACIKGESIEVYRQEYPVGSSFTACLGEGCVDEYGGFDSFPYVAEDPVIDPVQEDVEEAPDTEDDTGADISDGNDTSEESQVELRYPGTIEEYRTSCTLSGGTCTVESDTTSGTCRTIRFASSLGPIQIMACRKSDTRVEIYLQEQPADADFSACLESGCVRENQGFAKFDPQQVVCEQLQDTNPDEQVEEQEPVYTLSSLPVVCQGAGSAVEDFSDGSCRTIRYEKEGESATAKICQKSEGYEMYLLDPGMDICVGGFCVGSATGFQRFVY